MERVENVSYNSTNLMVTGKKPFDSVYWLNKNQLIEKLKEKDQKISKLELKLVKEARTLRKTRMLWNRLEQIANSENEPSSLLLRLRKIFEDGGNDLNNISIDQVEIDNKFICRLKKGYPRLTSNDLRICSLLRINLSTKEVAHSLAIGAESANKARYRIRKKLGLSRKDDLIQFILEY